MLKLKCIIDCVWRLVRRCWSAAWLPQAICWGYLYVTTLMLAGGCAHWLQTNVTPWFDPFNQLLIHHQWFNILTAALTTAGACWLIYKQDKHAVKTNALLLMALIAIATYQERHQLFNITIIGNINYAQLLTALIVAYLLTLIVVHVKSECRQQQPAATNDGKLTFITDTAEDQLVDVRWDGFAEMLTSFIINHPSRSRVLSLGINAVWGKGKSTFIKILIRHLKSRQLQVIEFNPWICKDETQITQEFFVALSSKLKQDNSIDIAKAVTKYAKTLLQFNANDNVDKLIDLIPLGSDATSLKEQKGVIDQKLQRLTSPIIVVIDDLDRMRCDEILAVFKLIRLTASFNNLVFISAYDRNHLARQLDEEQLTDATSYIDKIFHVEMELPEYESETCVNYLKEQIKSLVPQRKYKELDRDAFAWRNYNTIRSVLPTFRDANRFVNKFALKMYAMQGHRIFRECNLSDLFMYTLLEYRDPHLLSKIIASPTDYFVTTKQHHTDTNAYSVGRDGDNSRRPLMVKLKEEDETSFNLLSEMFPTYTPDHRRICLIPEFMKYVLLRAERNNLSGEEFMTILEQDDTQAAINTFSAKSLSSIIYWVRQTAPHNLKPEQLRRYTTALLIMLRFTNLGIWAKDIAKAQRACNYELQKEGDHSLSDSLKHEIQTAIQTGTCGNHGIAVLLRQLIDDEKDYEDRLYKDPDTKLHGEFMWGEEEYGKLFCANFEAYLASHSDLEPTDFARRNSMVNKIIQCSVFSYHCEDTDESGFDRQLINDPLQNYWRGKSDEVIKQVQGMVYPFSGEDYDQESIDYDLGTIFGNIEGKVDKPNPEAPTEEKPTNQ